MRGRNKQVIQRAIQDYLVGQGEEVFHELYAPDCLAAGPDSAGNDYGLAHRLEFTALRDQGLVFKSTFPDMVFHVDDIIEEGERVAARWTVCGADCGNSDARRMRVLFGLPEEGFSVSGVVFCRIQEGKIVELWQLSDMLTLARCLKLDQLARTGTG